MKVSISDAKANLSALVARVEMGEHVVITRRGMPVASLSNIPITEAIAYKVLTDPKNAPALAQEIARQRAKAPKGLTLADLLKASRE